MTSNIVVARVPGKLILAGEHFVLHGCKAWAIPLPEQSAEVKLEKAAEDQFEIGFLGWANVCNQDEWIAMLRADLEVVRSFFGLENNHYKVSFKSIMPPGVGGGTSAMWSVGLVKAFNQINNLSEYKQLALVQKLEDRHHGGKASGIDHATVWYNQPVEMDDGKLLLLEYQFLPEDWERSVRVVLTGIPEESTKEMVALFAKNLKQFPDMLKELQQVSELGQVKPKFSDTLNYYGTALEKTGMVSVRVAENLTQLRLAGFGAKVCGGGGAQFGSGLALLYKTNWSKKDEQIYQDWLIATGYRELIVSSTDVWRYHVVPGLID